MKFFALKMRVIARFVAMYCLISVGSAVPQAQAVVNTPTSGALLTINGNVGATPVNVSVSDKDIHSGTFNTAPCDLISTDSYVLQGGSVTGCDNGDPFEVTDNNPNSVHQQRGTLDLTGTGFSFHIETHYICGPSCGVFGTFTRPCNTSGTICANFDTGFITITNNSSSAFSGTITLSGTSPITAATSSFCPANGLVSDTWTQGLSAASVILAAASTAGPPNSVTLAMGSQGTTSSPTLPDSSNCGGFTSTTPQQAIAPGTTTRFLDGGIMDESVQLPADAIMNGAAFKSVIFMNIAQGVFDSTRLPPTGTNTWSGGAPVPAGTMCTIIKGTGTSSANDTCVVVENLCFDMFHVQIKPCNIIAPTTLIELTSHYHTSLAQTNPGLIIATDGLKDWANITNFFTTNVNVDPSSGIGGGTKVLNSDATIVDFPTSAFRACLLYDPTRAVKSGGAIPLKMYLCDSNVSDVSGVDVIVHATRLVQTSTNAPDPIVDAGSANEDLDFRFDATLGPSGGYIFNLKTTGLATGTYNLFYTAGFDTTEHLLAPLNCTGSSCFTFQVK